MFDNRMLSIVDISIDDLYLIDARRILRESRSTENKTDSSHQTGKSEERSGEEVNTRRKKPKDYKENETKTEFTTNFNDETLNSNDY